MMCTLGRPWTTPTLLERLQTQLSHQTPETSSATVGPLATQHLLEPASAISAPALVKDRFYLLSQHFVLQAPGTLGFEGVVVEPAATHPKGPTQFSATIAVRWVMESLSHFVELLGSWPKMAKAFFKMSRWRLTAANSRSSSAIRLWSAPWALGALRPCRPY
jgi:hypothetical protein